MPAASSAAAPVSSGVVAPSTIVDAALPVEGSGGGGNPIVQLAGYVKDSVVRMKDGTVELYTNHQKCNEIRSKQQLYAKLHDIKGKAAIAKAGGISYAEFDFLQRGKEDRSKLTQLVFMMFAAPNFLPYAIWLFPNMMPSPFSPVDGGSLGAVPETSIQRISRERTHAVIQTMLDLERGVHVPPTMSKLNPFGKKATSRAMVRLDRMGKIASSFLTTNQASGSDGAELVLDILEKDIYTHEEPKKRDIMLATVPKPIISGLAKAIEGQSSSFDLTFMVRGKILNHLRKVTDADDFLVNTKIDELDSELLAEACKTRLIGGPNRSDDENRESLSKWLEQTSIRPASKISAGGLHYNGNLARAALMCYHAVDGARDARSSSYLPRLLFQGQQQAPVVEEEEVVTRKRRSRRGK